MIKLIATDVDGTLVKDGTMQIDPEYMTVIKELVQKGIIFAVCSGIQFISERKLSNDVCRAIRHFRYYKGYGYYRSGYCQARIAAFDLERGSVVCSPAAKDLMEEYREILG